MSSRVLSGRSRLVGLGGLVLALSLVSTPALAFEQTSQTGTIGDVFLKDSVDHPGATCTYEDIHMVSLTVRQMKLMWPDNNPDVAEHGSAVLRAKLSEYSGAPAHWHKVASSGPVKLNIYDDHKTQFPALTVEYAAGELYYRGGFSIKWKNPNGSVRGTSSYRIQVHRASDGGPPLKVCPGSRGT